MSTIMRMRPDINVDDLDGSLVYFVYSAYKYEYKYKHKWP